MSDTLDTQQQHPSPEEIHNAVRNEHHKHFVLGDREFPIKDLAYDDYLEFIDLARPIIESVADSLNVVGDGAGGSEVKLDPLGLDFQKLIKLAGHELPRMAWICCKQSDPKIAIADVKRLAKRPFPLIEVVLIQVQHNKLIEEFQDFFPRLGKIVGEMVPEAQAAVEAVPTAPPSD